jgi:hypothetical protein
MMDMNNFKTGETIFGIREEWKSFSDANRAFIEHLPDLTRTIESAFPQRRMKARSIDLIVFLLDRLCCQDFWEIVLVCGNGYWMAAQKILRGMYERAVTARYLHLHPTEENMNSFIDFYWVSRHRMMEATLRTVGADSLPQEEVSRTREKFKVVKEGFRVPLCDKCGTKKLNHSWTKVDFVSMARECGKLGDFIVPAYYVPLYQTHPSLTALVGSLNDVDSGSLEIDLNRQSGLGRTDLGTAHAILLSVLDLQKEHFQIHEMENSLQTCLQDFKDIKESRKNKLDIQTG